jgi:hypothetical protein
VAGELTGEADVKLLNANLGIKTPLELEVISNSADAAGLAVPIPIWAFTCADTKSTKMRASCLLKFFMILEG